jgi:hypothetical protein
MITYLKMGGIAALAIALLAVGYHFGGLRGQEEADAAKTALAAFQRDASANVAKAVLAERASAEALAINDNAAEAAHDKTIESLPDRTVRTPVFVRGSADNCPSPGGRPVPATPAKAAGDDPAGRAVESGPGSGDIRPALEQFKIRYETALADCRRLDAEWPRAP